MGNRSIKNKNFLNENDINLENSNSNGKEMTEMDKLKYYKSIFKLNIEDKVIKRKNRQKYEIIYDKKENKLYENVKIKENKVSNKKDKSILINILKNHFIFKNLNIEELDSLINKIFLCNVNTNNYVFKQNDNASSFFIIKEGIAQIEIDNERKKLLGKGDGFGELALLYNAPRSGSVKAKESWILWGIKRDVFRKFVKEITIKNFKENRKFIDKISFFDKINDEQKNNIVEYFILLKFKKDEVIVNEGDQANSFYIIKSGEVGCIKNGKEVRILKEGDTFGEKSLFQDTKRSLTVISKTNTKLLSVDKNIFKQIFGEKIQNIIEKNWQKWSMEKDYLFKKLSNIQIEKILRHTKIEIYDEEFYLDKKILDKIYIVLNGSMVYLEENFYKFSIFNSKLIESNNYKLKNSILITKDTKLAYIKIIKLNKIFGNNILKVIKSNEELNIKFNKFMIKEKFKSEMLVKEVHNLEDFEVIKELSINEYKRVYLAKNIRNNKLYSVKIVTKNLMNSSKKKNWKNEKEILHKIDHPNIIKLCKYFEEGDYQIFVLEYYKGIELFEVIKKLDILNHRQSKYYIGSLILSLEYLHNLNIIYRNLKPENIIIDYQGRLILMNMEISKLMNKNKDLNNKTFTLVGTPHYIAPEILKGKGYNNLVDLWSLGILLYELMCGIVPFGEDSEDPFEIYSQITNEKNKIIYPNFFNIKENEILKDFIEQLLNKEPSRRLGRSFDSLKANKWFDDFNWDRLFLNELNPPFIPNKIDDVNKYSKKKNISSILKKLINSKNKKYVF